MLNVPTWPLNSSDSNSIEHLWNVPEQVWFMEAPPCNQQDSKNALPTPWYQTLRGHPLRDPVSVPSLLRAYCPSHGGHLWVEHVPAFPPDSVWGPHKVFIHVPSAIPEKFCTGAHCPVGRWALPLVLSPPQVPLVNGNTHWWAYWFSTHTFRAL